MELTSRRLKSLKQKYTGKKIVPKVAGVKMDDIKPIGKKQFFRLMKFSLHLYQKKNI